MNRLKLILIAASLLFGGLAFAGNKADTLKILTYNLRFGEKASMTDIAGYISSENPDIVALQECDWATYRERAPKQNGVKFINELAYHTGMFGVYGKAIDYRGGFYGVGILSKYPIVSLERVFLPNPDRKEQRVLLVAGLEMPDGEVLTFACTHLEVSSSRCRVEQAEFVNDYLEDRSPAILAGDMNAEPDSPEMKFLRKDWKDLTNRVKTYPVPEAKTKIDYIYAKPAGNVELLGTSVVGDIMFSDHFPVVSDIVLRH